MARTMTGVVHYDLPAMSAQALTEKDVRAALLREAPRGARLTGTLNYATRVVNGQITGTLVSCWYLVERKS